MLDLGSQFIVKIENDNALLFGILLPPAVQSSLPPGMIDFRLIDLRNNEYPVTIKRIMNRVYKLGQGNWPEFYEEAISVDREITTLCFRLERPNAFRVLCFNNAGIEVRQDDIGVPLNEIQMNMCFITASDYTSVEQLLPRQFLRELQIPNFTVKVISRKQDGEVEVIYNAEEGEANAHAEGFRGAQWSNVCFQNDVEDEFSLLITKFISNAHAIRRYYFYVDVFNKKGLGIGRALDPANEPPEENVQPAFLAPLNSEEEDDDFEGDTTDEEVMDNDNWDPYFAVNEQMVQEEEPMPDFDAEEEDEDIVHSCRVLNHDHFLGKPDCMVEFKGHAIRTNRLTLPNEFVHNCALYTYDKASLHFGELTFEADLLVVEDDRRPGDYGHMVCRLDWDAFSSDTAIMTGEWIRFELDLDRPSTAHACHFNIC